MSMNTFFYKCNNEATYGSLLQVVLFQQTSSPDLTKITALLTTMKSSYSHYLLSAINVFSN